MNHDQERPEERLQALIDAALGGALHIQSRAGGGTSLRAEIPGG